MIATALSMLAEEIKDGAVSEARSHEPRFTPAPHKRGLRQARKLTEEVLTFIGEVSQEEPSIRLLDLTCQNRL
jgi:hypothetical protein